jgi:hypothetical protein
VTSSAAPRSASWAAFAGGLGAVLLPKCPLCFAAYGTALGALGVSPAAYRPLVDLLLGLGVVASFALVAALSARRRDVATPVVSGLGAVLVLAGRLVFDAPAVTMVGAVVLVAAALVNASRCRARRSAWPQGGPARQARA